MTRFREHTTRRRGGLRWWGAAAVGVVALLAGALPAAAGPAMPVTINLSASFETGDTTFTTSGGPLCPSGITLDEARVVGEGAAITFHVDRTLVCDDGSGTFTVQIQAVVHPCNGTNKGAWVIQDGTGAYEQLHGAGQLIGTYDTGNACTATAVEDELIGRITFGGRA